LSGEFDAFGGWRTQEHQDPFWRYMQAGGKRACCVWHRRAGKDDVSLHWTCQAGHMRPGNYWHMLPQAEQARKAIWSAINPHTGMLRIDEAFPRELRTRTRTNEMMIEMRAGFSWQVVGSDNYNALMGSPPVGVVFSEWSLADPHAWAYIRPILRENGGWAIFIYTPRGRNHGYTLSESAKRTPGWFHQVLAADQSGVFSAEELALELAELQGEYGRDLGQNLFDQEYMCSFDAAILGAIYAAWIRQLERSGRIRAVPWNADYPVHTAWDLGFGDATAIWWYQIIRGQVYVIDFYQASGKDARHYCEQVLGHELIEDGKGNVERGADIPQIEYRLDWEYAEEKAHCVPHDAAHKTIQGGGRSFGDQCHGYGIDMFVCGQAGQATQISAARKTLERCWFDEEKCKPGLDALSHYHYEWDDQLKILKDAPKHDWASHPCDAFEIIGQVWQPELEPQRPEAPRFLHEATADEVFWPDSKGSEFHKERL
jgi:hypothetical protein